MTSIVFDAITRDGTIRIPDKYIGYIQSSVRVVLFPLQADIDKKSERIPFYGFDTTGYRFDRDEINER